MVCYTDVEVSVQFSPNAQPISLGIITSLDMLARLPKFQTKYVEGFMPNLGLCLAVCTTPITHKITLEETRVERL